MSLSCVEFTGAIATSLLLLISAASVGRACVCQPESPELAYCRADWVAHVHVDSRQENQQMPHQSSNASFSATRFPVKYIRMFKINKEMPVNKRNEVIVPVNVYSASYDNACGIQLEPGHEYLLAGQFVNGTMVTRLCGQILRETPKAGQPKDDILEWGEVPVQLQNKLGSQALDQLCPGLLAQQQPQSETTQKTAAQ